MKLDQLQPHMRGISGMARASSCPLLWRSQANHSVSQKASHVLRLNALQVVTQHFVALPIPLLQVPGQLHAWNER